MLLFVDNILFLLIIWTPRNSKMRIFGSALPNTTLRDDLSVGSIVYLSFWHVSTIYCTASRPNKEFCLLIQHAHILIHLRSASINGTYPGLPA